MPNCSGVYVRNIPDIFREYSPWIYLNKDKFLDLRSGFPDPDSNFFYSSIHFWHKMCKISKNRRIFQNFWKIFQNKDKNHQNIGYLDVWKLQNGKIIIDTECVRFARNLRLFQSLFWNQDKSHQIIVYLDDWKRYSPFQSQIAAKTLAAKLLV